MSAKVIFWGIRDQIPSSPSPAEVCEDIITKIDSFLQAKEGSQDSIDALVESTMMPSLAGFGAASHCLELKQDEESLIFDAGSGIKRLGDHKMVHRGLKLNPSKKKNSPTKHHLLLSSLQIERVLGLPFFTPIFLADTELHIYSVDQSAKDTLLQLFKKPFFPIEFKSLQSKIIFHTLKPNKANAVGPFKITPFKMLKNQKPWNFFVQTKDFTFYHWNGALPKKEAILPKGKKQPKLVYLGMNCDAAFCEKTLLKRLKGGLDLAKQLKGLRLIFGQFPPRMRNSEMDRLAQRLGKLNESNAATKKGGVKTSTSKTRSRAPKNHVQAHFAFEEQVIDLSN